METKFTPGPWKIGSDSDNARLIAAAPEMYELLEKVDALCKSPTDDHEFACDVEDVLDIWRELRARINA